MRKWPKKLLLAVLLAGFAEAGAPAAAQDVADRAAADGDARPDRIRFNRHIRPILADHCLACHGVDAGSRQADLRLDDPEDVRRDRDGMRIIISGDPAASELYRRITAVDEVERMPPVDQQHALTQQEIERLRRWIEEGAEYEPHWAFVPPERPQPPIIQDPRWTRHPIDAFVAARHEQQGIRHQPEADRAALIRRVTLDLTGLPPTPAEVDAFLADGSPDAYDKVVDRLLASPHYGERLAIVWLDAARFADTGGYQGDIPRIMWPWRDWVIAALNANMPFDQFTIEQLAGDLLPDATHAQQLATGFNRNHRINDEDGIVLEEFRVEYVVDRVETTSTVWMGLTLGCARCHDHKYDPLTQKEFYEFSAYFNSIAESGRGHGNAPPLLFADPAIDSEVVRIDRRLAELAAAGDAEGTGSAGAEAEGLRKRREELTAGAVTTMVMRELPAPRPTFVLVRGAYDKQGEQVHPGVPGVLPELPAGASPNRLTLAKWLVDPRHPLTARVMVNRLWLMMFGQGIVRTQEDFGTRGELPTDPEMLDWLATEFIRTGWDIKRMLRLIATSATYRQSSLVDGDHHGRDPDNRWLSRGPRYRLSAELIRDQALSAAGLLDGRIGGPSVKPYQPVGLWKEMVSFQYEYDQSHGSDLYRRGLYTYLRRTVPPPSMTALDMPAREICVARRTRTNTPLQSLVLMNDPTFVEAARALAARSIAGAAAPEERLCGMFRRVLARAPTPEEMSVLSETLQRYRQRFGAAPHRAREWIAVGEHPVDGHLDPVELAAYSAVASLILNLAETVTKE